MKCPHCGKERKDDAAFCDFCGRQIPSPPFEEKAPAPPSGDIIKPSPERADSIPSADVQETQTGSKDKPEKERTALRVLLIFVLLAFVGGGVLGFLTARGVISVDPLSPSSNFTWTSFSQGRSELTDTDEISDGKGNEKEESPESASSADAEAETMPSAETADSSSETTSPKETQPPTEIDAHYAKHIGDSLVVIDDKAHIWEEATIADLLENAKSMSELSGYSIMIVVTNDMFKMTSQVFADNYYEYVLSSNGGAAELRSDGYLFLINLADRECYLSAHGKAIDVYTDTALNELYGKIRQFIVDGDYEAAVNLVIEKTIYETKGE